FLSGENVADDGGVGRGVPTRNFLQSSSIDSELFGRDLVSADMSLTNFGDAGWSRNCNFVQAVQPVDHQSAMDTQHAERLSYFFHQIEGINPYDLRRSSRRIGERSEQVEDCPQAKFAAGGLHILHGG